MDNRTNKHLRKPDSTSVTKLVSRQPSIEINPATPALREEGGRGLQDAGKSTYSIHAMAEYVLKSAGEQLDQVPRRAQDGQGARKAGETEGARRASHWQIEQSEISPNQSESPTVILEPVMAAAMQRTGMFKTPAHAPVPNDVAIATQIAVSQSITPQETQKSGEQLRVFGAKQSILPKVRIDNGQSRRQTENNKTQSRLAVQKDQRSLEHQTSLQLAKESEGTRLRSRSIHREHHDFKNLHLNSHSELSQRLQEPSGGGPTRPPKGNTVTSFGLQDQKQEVDQNYAVDKYGEVISLNKKVSEPTHEQKRPSHLPKQRSSQILKNQMSSQALNKKKTSDDVPKIPHYQSQTQLQLGPNLLQQQHQEQKESGNFLSFEDVSMTHEMKHLFEQPRSSNEALLQNSGNPSMGVPIASNIRPMLQLINQSPLAASNQAQNNQMRGSRLQNKTLQQKTQIQKTQNLAAVRQELYRKMSLEGDDSHRYHMIRGIEQELVQALEISQFSPKALNYQQMEVQHNIGYSSQYFNKLILEKKNPKMGVYSHLKYAQHQLQQQKFGMDLMKDLVVSQGIELKKKKSPQRWASLGSSPRGSPKAGQDPAPLNTQDMKDLELSRNLEELINSKSKLVNANTETNSGNDVLVKKMSTKAQKNGPVLPMTQFQFQAKKESSLRTDPARGIRGKRKTAKVHAQFNTSGLGSTLKNIEKSFDQEQNRLAHGTGTVSQHHNSGANIESNPDQTLNESHPSVKKLAQEPIPNPIDVSQMVQHGEDRMPNKSKDETVFDRKLMENISEYSRSQKAKNRKKSMEPDKWEVNQRSESTENHKTRSRDASCEKSDHEKPKQSLYNQLNIQPGGKELARPEWLKNGHLKIRDLSKRQIEDTVGSMMMSTLEGGLGKDFVDTQHLQFMNSYQAKLVIDESNSEEKSNYENYLDSKLVKKSTTGQLLEEHQKAATGSGRERNGDIKHNLGPPPTQDTTMKVQKNGSRNQSRQRTHSGQKQGKTTERKSVRKDLSNTRVSVSLAKGRNLKVMQSPKVINLHQLIVQNPLDQRQNNRTELATHKSRLDRNQAPQSDSKPVHFTAFNFEQLVDQKAIGQLTQSKLKKRTAMATILNRGHINQSPYLKKLTDRVHEIQQRVAFVQDAAQDNQQTQGINNDVIKEIDQLESITPTLCLKRRSNFQTITDVTPQHARIESKSLSTFTNQVVAMKPALHATQQFRNGAEARQEDIATEVAAHSSFGANVGPSLLDKIMKEEKGGGIFPAIESPVASNLRHPLPSTKFETLRLLETDAKNLDIESIKVGESAIQGVDGRMTPVDKPHHMRVSLEQVRQRPVPQLNNQKLKKRLKNFHVNLNNINNFELQHQSSEHIGNIKGEIQNSAKSAQSAASIEHIEGKAMPRLERKQMQKQQPKRAKRSPRKEALSNKRRSKQEHYKTSTADIETKQSPLQSSQPILPEASSRRGSMEDLEVQKRASVINLNEFIQTAKRPSGYEFGGASPGRHQRLGASGSNPKPMATGPGMQANATHPTIDNRPEVGSVESEVISIVEVFDLDPKIGNQPKPQPPSKQTFKSLSPLGNSDLDIIINSQFNLPQVQDAKTAADGQRYAINENQANRTQRNLQVFVNNHNRRQEYIRERYKSQLSKYPSPSPLQSKEGTSVRASRKDVDERSPDGQRVEIQIPLNLDRMPLRYQFTSSNRDNHLTNFNSRQQHHKIEMVTGGSRTTKGIEKDLSLNAAELMNLLQNVHIRPQPLTNKIGQHYRSRSSLMQNYLKQRSNEFLIQKQTMQEEPLAQPDRLAKTVIQTHNKSEGLALLHKQNVKKLTVQPQAKKKVQVVQEKRGASQYPLSQNVNGGKLPTIQSPSATRERQRDREDGFLSLDKSNDARELESPAFKMETLPRQLNLNEVSFSQELEVMCHQQETDQKEKRNVNIELQPRTTVANNVGVQAQDIPLLLDELGGPNLRKDATLVRVQDDDGGDTSHPQTNSRMQQTNFNDKMMTTLHVHRIIADDRSSGEMGRGEVDYGGESTANPIDADKKHFLDICFPGESRKDKTIQFVQTSSFWVGPRDYTNYHRQNRSRKKGSVEATQLLHLDGSQPFSASVASKSILSPSSTLQPRRHQPEFGTKQLISSKAEDLVQHLVRQQIMREQFNS